MELTGQQTLSLPIDKVWAALNDPDILQKCIPGCDTFERVADNQYKIVMTATVGPIKAKFTGKLVLSDIVPPKSYRLKFEGSGGAAGSGKGTADVQVSEVAGGTLLQYSVSATVAGRLAQVGARLIDGVAKKMADQFFSRFKSILDPEVKPEQVDGSGVPPIMQEKSTASTRGSGLKWAAAAIAALVAVGLYIYSN